MSKTTQQSFARRRRWLVVVVGIWICFYILSEFPTEAYENGGGALDAAQLLFNVLCFFSCLLVVIVSLFRKRFNYGSDAFILLGLLLAKAAFGNAIVYADLGLKAIMFSAAPGLCQMPDSDYLKQTGLKLCYSWVHDPDARFVVSSPVIDLTKNIDAWPLMFRTELAAEKTRYNFIATCGYRDVHRALNNTYFIKIYCQ
ncbi:MAG: hypothetical protein Q8M11_07810 [Sulfuritalea sp.]|nr:hypothetical protein [Sulfuritalea sp.]